MDMETRSRRAAMLAVLLALLACGCARREVPARDANVVVLLMDTFRRDRLGMRAQGPGDLTPNLERLAEEGVWFKSALAPSSWTKPSVASLMTGLYPGKHEAVGDLVRLPNLAALSPDFSTLAERFKAEGWRTGAFVTNPHVTKGNHFDQGFDTFVQPAGDARELLGKALEWVREESPKGKFFLYLHLIDAHAPYQPPPEYIKRCAAESPGEGAPLTEQGLPMEVIEWRRQYAEWRARDPGPGEPFKFDYAPLLDEIEQRLRPAFPGVTREDILPYLRMDFQRPDDPGLLRRIAYLISLYNGEVNYLDDAVQEFLDALKASGVLGKTVLVVTADHGEAFMEHKGWGHRLSVFGPEIEIPLIFRIPGPNGNPIHGRFDEPVSLVDLYPTLLDLFGFDAKEGGLDGVSLGPVLRGEDAGYLRRRPVFSELILDRREQVSSVLGRKKVIRTEGAEGAEWAFYDLDKDPAEQRPEDLADAGAEGKALMRSVEVLLKSRHLDFEKKTDVETPSEQELKELQNLGYL